MPATVERNEKINKYLSSVNLRPFAGNPKEFGEVGFDFRRKDLIIDLMKKVALQSSQNFKRNADAFLSTVSHDNGKFWPINLP